MKDGLIKVAAGTPELRVADVEFNKRAILDLIEQAGEKGVKILALPELCLTGYTCADLFFQDALLRGAEDALAQILAETKDLELFFALGIPVGQAGQIFNCAAVCNRGRLLALVPKTYIPDYGEFQESRWFASGGGVFEELVFAGQNTCLGAKVIFPCPALPDLCLGVEICEDLWVAAPPSSALAGCGATIILNLSASSDAAYKAAYRRELVKTQSARLICGYVYAGAGQGESTTDVVFSGHSMIAENGELLRESIYENGMAVSEIDISYLQNERRRIKYSNECEKGDCARFPFDLSLSETYICRAIPRNPFVPEDRELRFERCEEILNIASHGLKKRIAHTGSKSLVLGVSGGLDSTLAMLISVLALDMLGMPRESIIAVTMPGFGTTSRTRDNAVILAESLGAALRTISIEAAVRQHFEDIGHDDKCRDVVYENAQARERTQVLMDIANGCGGLVVGTGDMSELALGWATFNGDHMSMYGVNSGIPKTLVRYLVEHCAEKTDNKQIAEVLRDILATPVSPELLPSENGKISQMTEELVGPYELHDFFLFHMIRRGSEPKKILRMAGHAFAGEYDADTILKWLRIFIRRFFSQQFKRNCLPDGPKVGSLSLSPRGDFRMPSDAVSSLWLKQLDAE